MNAEHWLIVTVTFLVLSVWAHRREKKRLRGELLKANTAIDRVAVQLAAADDAANGLGIDPAVVTTSTVRRWLDGDPL